MIYPEVLHGKYARALIDDAQESGLLERVRSELEAINKLLGDSPALFEALTHPEISPDEKRGLLESIAKEQGFSKQFKAFLFLLIAANRVNLLQGILIEYAQLCNLLKDKIEIYVKSPFALSQTEREKLIKALGANLNKKVILQEKIDPGLIAGISIRAGDDVFDNSLRKNLGFIKEAMVK